MTHNAEFQPHLTPLIPGNWRAVVRDGKPGDPFDTIKFACPNCGVEADLSEHEIDGDGRVSPSLICPKGCGFHDLVVLEGYGEE